MFEVVSSTVRKSLFVQNMKLADTPAIESRLREWLGKYIVPTNLNVACSYAQPTEVQSLRQGAEIAVVSDPSNRVETF